MPSGYIDLDGTGNRKPSSDELAATFQALQMFDGPSRRFPLISGMTRRAIAAAPTPAPLAKNTGTEIYIDPNRGNDTTGTGTRLSPYASLAKISGLTYGAGTVIALASDGLFELQNGVSMNNWNGDVGNKLIITSYDPAGHTGTKPRITRYLDIPNNAWTWDAAANGWYYTLAAGNMSFLTALFFGPSKLQGIRIWQEYDLSFTVGVGRKPPFNGDRQFGVHTDYNTVKRLYVSAPSNQNPTDYYNGVRLAGHNAPLATSNGLKNSIVENLEFVDGMGLYVLPSSGAHTGLVVRNCKGTRANVFSWESSFNGAHSFEAYENEGTEVPAALIKVYQTSGGGTHTASLYRNKVIGANRQFSAMGGLAYLQLVGVTMGDIKAYANYAYDCTNGTGSQVGSSDYGCPFDGCALYADITSQNALISGNFIERCAVALQSNSAKSVQFIGNMAVDCDTLLTSSDAANVGSNDVTVLHNTLHDTKNAALPRGATSQAQWAINMRFETTTGNKIKALNNLFVRDTLRLAGPAIRVDSLSTNDVAGNAVFGWNDAIKAITRPYLTGSDTDITSTAVVALSTADVFAEGVRPKAGSQIENAGVRFFKDMVGADGIAFDPMPTIGALEVSA